MSVWTDDKSDKAVALWREGRSAASIASELGPGFTRNAILGRIHRLGLSVRIKTKKWAPASLERVKAAKTPQDLARASVEIGASPDAIRRKLQRESAPAPTRTEVAEAHRHIAAPLNANPVTLLDRGPDQCCFPMGEPRSPDFRYCGALKPEDVSYCAHHERVMYQPRLERPKLQQPPQSRITREMRGEWA